jgi:hypothetical protein
VTLSELLDVGAGLEKLDFAVLGHGEFVVFFVAVGISRRLKEANCESKRFP